MPSVNNVHVNQPLTNISIGVWQSVNSFAFNRVFATVPVNHKSDVYYKSNVADMLRDDMRPRAPGTESAGTGYNVGTGDYNIRVFSIHHDISDQVRANADSVLSLDSTTTKWLTQMSMIRQEKIFSSQYLTTGQWNIDVQGAASGPTANQVLKWTDDASDPVADVNRHKTLIQLAGGLRPNVFMMTQDVRDALDTNPAIIDRIKYSGGIGNDTPVVVNETALAKVFGVEEIVVTSAIENIAAEGAPAQNRFIASGKALLVYRTRTPGLDQPTGGFRFTWKDYLNNNEGVRVKKFRVETLESDRIEVDLATDMAIAMPEVGALFYDLV